MKTPRAESILRPYPGCDNCGGTGWIEYSDKRGVIHGQLCFMCELSWRIEEEAKEK